MKSLIYILICTLGTLSLSVSSAIAADDYCTFYHSSSYGGKELKMESGDHYPSKWDWHPRSLKLGKDCYVVFYYKDKYGKKKKYTFKSSTSNLYNTMSKWKLKSKDYWNYIDKVVIVCGLKEGHSSDNGGNNRGMSAKEYYEKGRVVYYREKGYQGSYHAWSYGEYNPSRFEYKPMSLKIPENAVCIIRYKDKNNRMKQGELRGTISDVYSEFKGWGFKDYRNAYKYITEFRIQKYNDNQGGQSGNGNRNSNNVGMSADDYYKKGHVVYFKEGGYRGSYKAWSYGEYNPSRFDFYPVSLRIPENAVCVIRYKDKNNRMKQGELRGTISDVYSKFKGWGFKDYKNAYKYITEFKIQKYGGSNNGGNSNSNGGGYKGDDLFRKGYVVFYSEYDYKDDYYGKTQGSYDVKKLKFYPASLRIPSSLYIVLQYQDSRKRIKSQVFKGHVKDLKKELSKYRLYDQQHPLESIRKITVMRY